MGRVLTNNVSLSYGLQADQDTDPTEWFLLEPNAINNFGATITTVSRDPISKNRQRRKGVVTDLDSAAEWEGDLTGSHYNAFIQCYAFADATNIDLDFVSIASVTATAYTVPILDDPTQISRLLFNSGGPISLLYARGFGEAGNNGLKELSSAPLLNDTELDVAGLTIENTPPTNSELEIAGVRCSDSDLSLTYAAGPPATATITSGNGIGTAVDFTVLGLTVGQFIHVGGITSTNQFATIVGFARITSIAAGTLTLDKLDSGIDATDDGDTKSIDLLFGRFTRNVPVDHANYHEQFITFEGTFPNLDNDPAGDMYQYSLDNLCNTAAFNLPLTDKATVTFGFVGTDTDNPVDTQKSGADTPIEPNQTAAFGTTSDIARLQLADLSDDSYGTCFKSLTLTLNNQVTPEKCIGTLGAQFMNAGNFQVDLESQLLFTDATIINAIRDNQTVTLDFRLDNDDGAIVIDIPNMTIGGGDREFPVNESVLVNVTGEAFGEPAGTYTYSLGSSQFPIKP